MIILYKGKINPCGFVAFLVPRFDEVAPGIPPHFGLDKQYTLNGSLNDFHKLLLRVHKFEQILTISILRHGFGQTTHIIGRNIPFTPGNFFEAGNFEALPGFHSLHKRAGFQQRVMRPGVEPCNSTSHQFHMQIATLQVQIVDISNFQLPTSGGFHLFRDIHYASVVEIEAGHSKIGFRFLGLFFNTDNPLAFVKLHHAVSMRIADVIAENGRPCISLHGSIQKISHPLPKENIVSKHKADIVAANKIFGQQKGLRQPVGIAVDTGMGRIGYLADDIDFAVSDVKKIAALENFKIKGMFSHMSTADAYDKTYSHQQEAKFNKFYEALTAAGIEIPFRTLANSASIMELPTVHFDACRPGIILYGCYPSDEVDVNELSIKPVMSVKANIVHLKDVPADFSVGYGRKYISKKPSKIATIALGYADGYPRPYSPNAKVIVNGVIAPIAGNICMDQCMIDVTDVPDVKLGDEVIVMGSDGTNTILADDIARATGTINYEITCAFGQRLPKVYVK